MPRTIATVVFGVFMLLGGVGHFVQPSFYLGFFPEGVPAELLIALSGVVEVAIGLATLVPKTRLLGARAILVAMLVFLPLHVVDVFRDHPAIGSHTAALIRLPIQFVLIAWAAWISGLFPRRA